MHNKKKIGIIGGMGSRAGALFLQKIIDHSPALTDQEFPEIIFHNNSMIPDRTKAIVYNEPSPLDEILRSIDIFNTHQVEVIALACVTSYYYFDLFASRTDATVINPVHLMYEAIMQKAPLARRIGLLATTGTIRSGLFHQELGRFGMEVITLPPVLQEQVFMRSVYMKNGFKSARVGREAQQLMAEALAALYAMEVDLIIGGCTEVSVGIDPAIVTHPYIDVLDLFARKVVECCYNTHLIMI